MKELEQAVEALTQLRVKALKNNNDDLEKSLFDVEQMIFKAQDSLQSKGKTKEYVPPNSINYLEMHLSPWFTEEELAIGSAADKLFQQARKMHEVEMEEYAQSHANKDGLIIAEKRTDIECPECGEHHVDRDEWSKRLHKKHLCERCGHVWQPHEGYTFGIETPPQP